MNKKSQFCPYCQSSKSIKSGFSGNEKVQRFRCKHYKKIREVLACVKGAKM